MVSGSRTIVRTPVIDNEHLLNVKVFEDFASFLEVGLFGLKGN